MLVDMDRRASAKFMCRRWKGSRMVAQMVSDLSRALSSDRLEAYRPTGGDALDMVVNYFWNIDLAEAIVPSLHAFEIALRNAIHNALTASQGTDMWFFKEGLLEPGELRDFATAYGSSFR